MLYTAKDVKTACNQVLVKAFPDIAVYDSDTFDGYRRPSFFVELASRGRTRTSRYLTQFGYRYRVTYFEITHDEAHCLDVYQQICGAFEPFVVLRNDRKNRLFVEDVGMQWVDEHADKLQVTIDFYQTVELGGYVPEGEAAAGLEITTHVKNETEV